MGSVFLLAVALFFSELYLLIEIGDEIGFWSTLALLIGTAIVGYHVAKREGLRVWSEYQHAISTGGAPPDGVLEGLLILLGGALLIVPGVITDAFGVLLLIPWSRRRIGTLARTKFQKHMAMKIRTVPPRAAAEAYEVRVPRQASVIETTGEGKDDEPPDLRRLRN